MELTSARRAFSRVGLGCFVILAVTAALQLLCGAFILPLFPDNSLVIWLYTFVPMYVVGMPLGVLVFRTVPKGTAEESKLGAGRFWLIFLICIFMMYAGNIVGSIILTITQMVTGVSAVNPVMSYLTDDNTVLKVLVVAVIGPVMEEFIFRKQVIDRLLPYGEKLALVTSALIFGLFHGNLSQFFYAAALGAVFGYVYIRTGRLRYPILYHVMINFMGGVVAPALLANLGTELTFDPGAMELEQLLSLVLSPGFIAYMVYAMAFGGSAIAGLVMLILNAKRVTFRPVEGEVPRGYGFGVAWCNVGMALFVLGCVGLIALTFLPV